MGPRQLSGSYFVDSLSLSPQPSTPPPPKNVIAYCSAWPRPKLKSKVNLNQSPLTNHHHSPPITTHHQSPLTTHHPSPPITTHHPSPLTTHHRSPPTTTKNFLQGSRHSRRLKFLMHVSPRLRNPPHNIPTPSHPTTTLNPIPWGEGTHKT